MCLTNLDICERAAKKMAYTSLLSTGPEKSLNKSILLRKKLCILVYLYAMKYGLGCLKTCKTAAKKLACTCLLSTSSEEHPWAGEDLSLKIDERDQTIWICILELQLFHSNQMKLKLQASFIKNPPDGAGGSLKRIESKY